MIERLRQILRHRSVPAHIRRTKLRAIDRAVELTGARSLADLGGVWAVDGAYSLYALNEHRLERVLICDEDFTPALEQRAEADQRLTLVQGNFGRDDIAARIGRTDAILLFDVLLHQVQPDWDEILSMYASQTSCIVLAGPWWRGDETVRLTDLSRDAYLDLVPMREFHAEIYDRLDEFNDRRGRPWRDCHDIWQWGIAPVDLDRRLQEVGFELVHSEHGGSWRGLDGFEDISMVYARARS